MHSSTEIEKITGKEPAYNNSMTSYTIERRSPLTGKLNSMEITMNPQDYIAFERGKNIQDALPYLTTDEREFIKTGIYQGEWEDIYPAPTS